MSAGGIIGGIIVIVAGFFVTWKSFPIFQAMGRIDWAERKLVGFGGTAGMIKFIGIAMIIIGFLYLSGGCDYIINKWLGEIFRGMAQ